MFPSIQKLQALTDEGREVISFLCIWTHWVGLKELRVEDTIQEPTENFDCVFCGVFPEEMAELRQKDEDFLRRVNIVPVMPAITCLRGP